MKKVSVIIPIYNAEKYLKKCLDSVVNQTYSNIEIILINDGSTDSSLKICEEYNENFKNIILINKVNGGQGIARNLGIEKATGHYLTFVDSDDWVEETMIEKMYNVSNNGEIDVVIADIYKVINNKNQYFYNYIRISNDNNTNLIVSHPGPVAKLIKRELLVKNKLQFLENRVYEDLALLPLIGIVAKTIFYLNEPLYYYLIRTNSTMKLNKFNLKLDDIFYVLQYLEQKFEIYDKNEKYKAELEYLYIEHLLYSASLRFLDYGSEGVYRLEKIIRIMRDKYPNWENNILFINRNLKFKFITKLIYTKRYRLLKILKRWGKK